MSSQDGPGGNSSANITGSSGLASDKTTPANAGVGAEKPGLFDSKGMFSTTSRTPVYRDHTAPVLLGGVQHFDESRADC